MIKLTYQEKDMQSSNNSYFKTIRKKTLTIYSRGQEDTTNKKNPIINAILS